MDKKECIQTLHNSITFQMSLGSKELFHTNFLQWLSIVDWNRFLSLLHSLTGENEFWWEKQICNVEAIPGNGPKPFHPDNENIEVRREHNNYDLSIYILVGYSKPRNEGEARKKWRPVLILENKVKSMPYQEQLDGYAQKAYDEWEGSHPKGQAKDWATEGITFVLLSLFDEVNFNPSHITTISGGNISVTWTKRNYSEVSSCIHDSFKGLTGRGTCIIDDYCTFLKALHNLSQSDDWNVSSKDNYYDKMIKPAEEEVHLRIADIREKIHHERMLKILIDKLQTSTILKGRCEHWNKEKEFKGPKGKKHYNTGVVFYETDFSRGRGATQVFVIVNDVYRLMIQLQNNQYRRCVILHPTEEDIDNKFKRICDGLNKIWSGYARGKSFGKFFNYQYITITDKTVNDILDDVVCDLKAIFSNMEHLKNLR